VVLRAVVSFFGDLHRGTEQSGSCPCAIFRAADGDILFVFRQVYRPDDPYLADAKAVGPPLFGRLQPAVGQLLYPGAYFFLGVVAQERQHKAVRHAAAQPLRPRLARQPRRTFIDPQPRGRLARYRQTMKYLEPGRTRRTRSPVLRLWLAAAALGLIVLGGLIATRLF
jgi:hypothetical protein